MYNWRFVYQNVESPFSVGGKNYNYPITVIQNDETSPPVPFSTDIYQLKTFGKEIYAKGVGLIFKEFLNYTHQEAKSDHPVPYFDDGSYGVKLHLIDHN